MAANLAASFQIVVALAMISSTRGEDLNSETDISIPADEQVTQQSGEKQYYRIWVNKGKPDQEYFADKRYSDFYALYGQLEKLLPGQKLFDDAPLPGRLFSTSFEERRPALEKWLQTAVKKLADFDQMTGDLMSFLDTAGGAAAATSGISMPIHDHRPCSWTHFHGIRVRGEDGIVYTIFRRYNMFLELKSKLGPAAEHMAGNVGFPLAEVNPLYKDVDARRKALERWLQEVVKSPNRHRHWKADIDTFLDFEDARVGYLKCIADFAGAKVEDLIFDKPGCVCEGSNKGGRDEL